MLTLSGRSQPSSSNTRFRRKLLGVGELSGYIRQDGTSLPGRNGREHLDRFQLEGDIDLGKRDGEEVEEKVVGDGEGVVHHGDGSEGGDNGVEGRENEDDEGVVSENEDVQDDSLLSPLRNPFHLIRHTRTGGIR